MINDTQVELHMHLWYLDTSIYLMDLVSSGIQCDANISLVKDSPNNTKIIDYAKQKFKSVNIVESPNRGNDQCGFFKSVEKNSNPNKNWIFYAHDKHPDKIDWIDQIVKPIVSNSSKINKVLESGQDEVGIISSSHPKRMIKTFSEEELVMIDKAADMGEKVKVVLSRQTLIWLRELQYILYDQHGYIDKDNLNFTFTAGTMFIINKEIFHLAKSCTHENFFPNAYRPDGDMPHALERFYFYVSLAAGKNNIFI